MISQEFKAAVEARNLLKARIMMKDAFLTDLTFAQLDEMLRYVKAKLPAVCIVPYDGGFLEPDSTKWDRDTMNSELVDIVDNFSTTRIEHLKKVVQKVITPATSAPGDRGEIRKNALRKLYAEGKKISKTIQSVDTNEKWMLRDVDALEQAAEQILQAARAYKANLPKQRG